MADIDRLRQRHRHLIDRIARHDLLDEFISQLPIETNELTLDEVVNLNNSLAPYYPNSKTSKLISNLATFWRSLIRYPNRGLEYQRSPPQS